MRPLAAFVVSLSIVTGILCSARAAEDEIPWHKLKQAAERYLDTCVTKQDRKAMAKDMDARIEQRVQDTGAGAEQAAREIMFDWAADNSDNVAQQEQKAVAQVCYYFVLFTKKGFIVSHQIRERLTPPICDEIL